MKNELLQEKGKTKVVLLLFIVVVIMTSKMIYDFFTNPNIIEQKANYIILQVIIILVTVYLFVLYLRLLINKISKVSEELLIMENKYSFVFGLSEKLFFEYTISDSSVKYSERLEKLLNRKPIEIGLPYSSIEKGFVHPESTASFMKVFEDVKKGIPSISIELRLKDGFGKYIWCLISAVTIFNKNNVPIKGLGVIDVISDKKELENKYNEVLKYKSAIDSENIVICDVNLTKNFYLGGYEEILSMTNIESENNYSNVIRLVARDYFHVDNMYEFMLKNNPSNLVSLFLSGITDPAFEYKITDSYKKEKWLCFKYKLYESPKTKDICAIISIIDISEQKRKEAELIDKAEKDQMTGLYNKTTTEKLINDWIQNHRSSIGVLMMIDIDNFKNVNDKLGHLYGDMIIKKLAEALKSMFRANDVVGRIGGDEFFVFLKKLCSEKLVIEKAKTICKLFHNVYKEKDISCEISSSVGIALFPKHGNTLDSLYEKADIALYQRKEKGKNGFIIYDEEN